MKIALDWDLTYTLNPSFWNQFIRLCLFHNVDVRIVTLRHEKNKIDSPFDIPVVYTNYEQKRDHCLKNGWHPDVWIDDTPELIVPQSLLDVKFRDNND